MALATTSGSFSSGTLSGVLSVRAGSRNLDRLQFWAICAICFPPCLLTGVFARLAPARRMGSRSSRSLVAEALAAAGTTARIAFSG